MVRPKQEEIDKELKKLELDTDGSESVSGSSSVAGTDETADTGKMVEDVIGNDPTKEEEFNIGTAASEDDIAEREHKINDYKEEENEDNEEEKEDETEEATVDPFQTLEDDDLDEPSEE